MGIGRKQIPFLNLNTKTHAHHTETSSDPSIVTKASLQVTEQHHLLWAGVGGGFQRWAPFIKAHLASIHNGSGILLSTCRHYISGYITDAGRVSSTFCSVVLCGFRCWFVAMSVGVESLKVLLKNVNDWNSIVEIIPIGYF